MTNYLTMQYYCIAILSTITLSSSQHTTTINNYCVNDSTMFY